MKSECNAVFLFIAELTGSFKAGSGTVDDKIECGQKDYIIGNLPELDLNDEEDRKELHEVIWLERLYNELDEYFELKGCDAMGRFLAIDQETYRYGTYQWSVPIETDASASMLQHVGVLLGDKRLMEMTNVIGDTLEDPWALEGMSRTMLKTAATPMLYASSKTCHELWQKAGIDYTKDDIELYNKEMADGPFGLVNLLKEFIINNCTPKAEMEIDLGGEKFSINCNRYRNVGEHNKAYKAWDSIDKQFNVVLHTDTRKVPDLEQFRRFFMTLLVHNRDAKVMDSVMVKVMDKYGWGIPIHDAAVVSPAAAADVRKWYAEELTEIYNNRQSILSSYFNSIGITDAAMTQWENLKSKIVPFEGEFKCSPMALK